MSSFSFAGRFNLLLDLGETVQHLKKKGKRKNEGNGFQSPTGENPLRGLIGMKMVALSWQWWGEWD